MTESDRDLHELRERIRKAKGANREIDRDVAVATGMACRKTGTKAVEWNYKGVPAGTYSEPPEYTASIDAALRLVEEKLPGWRWHIDSDYFCGLERPNKTDDEPGWDACNQQLFPTASLAILDALLTALLEGDTHEQTGEG